MKIPAIFVALLLLTSACRPVTNVYNDQSPAAASPAAPSTPAPLRVEYRVSGNANSVRIRYYNVNDGLVQVTTTLPYSTSFTTTQDNLFLSLEVTPISYSVLVTFPFLSAQIFVNGSLFREATSNEVLLSTLSVNGTWRR